MGITSQSTGSYMLGEYNSTGLILVSNESDFGLYSYIFIYGRKAQISKINGGLDISVINEYGTVVASGATSFHCVKFRI